MEILEEIYKKVKGSVDKYKKVIKRLIIAGVTIAVIGGVTVVGIGYTVIKANLNCTKAEAQAIALQEVAGEVVGTNIDFDDWSLGYEVKVRTAENKLVTVTVDTKYGAISDIENSKYATNNNEISTSNVSNN